MKKVKILTIILAIILVTMVAFGGIYIQVQNRMSDKVKDYSYAMDLKGSRNIRLKVSDATDTIIKDAEGKEVEETEELTDEQLAEKGYTKEENPVNSQDALTEENYEKSKNIIEKRLKALGVDNYIIKLNQQTGEIVLEIPENDQTDAVVSNISTTGKFEIIDTETQEVLMDNNDIKLANVMYGSDSSTGTTSSGTMVYLNIEFTKDGAKKLEDISNKYVKTENTDSSENTDSAENTENSEETTEKTITMKIDDEEIMSTSFDETIKTGKMQLSIGSSTTDSKTLQNYVSQASSMGVILDNGKMPVEYEISENEYVLSDITSDKLQIVEYTIMAIVAIALIVLIIRYKAFGILGAISYIGLASIFVLVIRYANVVLSIEGIFAIAIILILNYIFVNKLLSKLKDEKVNDRTVINKTKETYKEFFIKIVPICIAVVTFSFINWSPISSFGMVMFWGIALIALYNFIVTNNILKIKASK